MAAEFAGRSRTCFDLKRTTFPLLSLVLRSTDLAEIEAELHTRFGDSPDFFDQDLLVLNLAGVREVATQVDFDGLLALLRSHRLQPIGVHGGSEAQMQAAHHAGLVTTPEVSAANSMARSARPDSETDATGSAGAALGGAGGEASGEATTARNAGVPSAAASDRGAAEAGAASAPARAIPSAARTGAAGRQASAQNPSGIGQGSGTVVIDTPMRSGQRVYAKGADLVVLEAVSFGAEVFADGNIHVYAPLRGRAIAGARGDESARIFTTCLDPQLVAIAGVYKTIDTPLPDDVAGKPAQVRRAGDSLIIEPL